MGEGWEHRPVHNEEVFRRANERLREDWARLGIDAASEALFLCECADAACRDPIRIRIADYEAVRTDPDAFMIVPGHENETVEPVGAGPADPDGRFTVVHKRREAG